LFITGIVFSVTLQSQPVINSWSGPDTVDCYNIAEYVLDINASYTNPYSAEEVSLFATFTAPGGENINANGFYMIPYTLVSPDTLSSPGAAEWRVRFAPENPGIYTFKFTLTDQSGTTVSQTDTLHVTSSSNDGFYAFNGNYLHSEAGDVFLGVGENMGWVADYQYSDFDRWTDSLAANNCNLVRIWFTVYTFQIEWNNAGPVGYYTGRMNRAWWLDWFLEMTREKGIKVQLCLNSAQAFIVTGYPSWNYNPYSTVQGGPCEYPWQFFVNEDARYFFKRKLRYILARWGAYDNISAWELFNEVDGVDGYAGHQNDVVNWHNEMAQYLHTNDNYDRPVSTSFMDHNVSPNTWALQSIDFTQGHRYYSQQDVDYEVYRKTRELIDEYEKPATMAEFNLHVYHSNNYSDDPTGLHMHNTMWASLFSGSFSSALPWFWSQYIDEYNLYHQFKGPATFSGLMTQIHNTTPELPPVSSSEKTDLIIIPGLQQTFVPHEEDYFNVGRNGIMIPDRRELASMLYGYGFSNYRNPPHFIVDYDEAGTFTVRTGSIEFFSKIRITVDGVLLLEQNAMVNTDYTISLPAGEHVIHCENVGNGYVSIEEYEFGNYGALIRCYATSNDSITYGWVQHINYNHVYLSENGIPDPVESGTIDLGAHPQGYYYLDRFAGSDGTFLSRELITNTSGNITIDISNLQHDQAFILTGQPESVSASIEVSDSTVCLPGGVFFSDVTTGIYNSRKWIFEGGSPSVTSNENIYVNYFAAGVYDVTLIHFNDFGSDTTVFENLIQVNAPAGITAGISVPQHICTGESGVIVEASPVGNAEYYEWDLPAGCTGVSDSTAILLTLDQGFISGEIGCRAWNYCGAGDWAYVTLEVDPPPATIDVISGPAEVCNGATNIYFSVDENTGATSYLWSLGDELWSTVVPFITLDFLSTGIFTLNVEAFNECGESSGCDKQISVKNPVVFAGLIAGKSNVYQTENTIPYFSSVIPNATSYLWTFPEGFHAGSTTTKNISLSFDNSATSGAITCRGKNACGTGPVATKPIEVKELPSGWSPLYYGDFHKITVISDIPVFLDNIPLAEPYTVGVFYPAAPHFGCGGAFPSAFFSQNSFFLYGDDASTNTKDGFYSGDSLVWMVYSEALGESFFATAEWFSGPQTYTSGATSVITALYANTFVTDTLMIPDGWSGLSSYIIPNDTLLTNLFGQVDEELVIVKTLDGLVYWPPWANNLEFWNADLGYKTNFSSGANMVFSGHLNLQREFALEEGWNEVPVPVGQPVNSSALFVPLGDTLVIAKASVGNGVFWPEAGINTLQELFPGNACMLYVNHPVTIHFPSDTLWPGGFPNPAGKSSPFSPPSPSGHIFIFDQPLTSKMQMYSTISAFSSKNKLCGFAEISDNNDISVAVYGGSEYSGLPHPGSQVFFLPEGDTTLYVPVIKNKNYNGWQYNGFDIITDLVPAPLSGITNNFDDIFVSVSPNPATESVRFIFHKGNSIRFTMLKLYNSEGKCCLQKKIPYEDSSLEIDLRSFVPGMYHYRVETQGRIISGKLVVI
jgi:hypothetical protein